MTPLLLGTDRADTVRVRDAAQLAAGMVYVERKVAALLQQRVGPYLVGYKGLLQPLADVIKLMFKEELRPRAADPILFRAGADHLGDRGVLGLAVVQFGAETTFFGLLDEPLRLQVSTSMSRSWSSSRSRRMGVYRHRARRLELEQQVFADGRLRASAQMISYELSYGLALASVLVIGKLAVAHRSGQRAGRHVARLHPALFVFLQPLSFLIFMTAASRKTNRAPFDFPEAEQELVADITPNTAA